MAATFWRPSRRPSWAAIRARPCTSSSRCTPTSAPSTRRSGGGRPVVRRRLRALRHLARGAALEPGKEHDFNLPVTLRFASNCYVHFAATTLDEPDPAGSRRHDRRRSAGDDDRPRRPAHPAGPGSAGGPGTTDEHEEPEVAPPAPDEVFPTLTGARSGPTAGRPGPRPVPVHGRRRHRAGRLAERGVRQGLPGTSAARADLASVARRGRKNPGSPDCWRPGWSTAGPTR